MMLPMRTRSSPGSIGWFASALALTAALLSACATRPTMPAGAAAPAIQPLLTAFSSLRPAGGLPKGWAPVEFGAFKRPTEYQLVDHDGRTSIEARADNAASMLVHPVSFDPRAFPTLRWSWNVPALIRSADNTLRHREDAPARIVVAFDGDWSTLPPLERLNARQFSMLTGNDMPFATIMYIRGNNKPVDTLITSSHTDRIKFIVAETGPDGLGTWQHFSRNLLEDYRRAFGAEPGKVAWIGLMTDTDNTRERARAYYGDVSVARLGH